MFSEVSQRRRRDYGSSLGVSVPLVLMAFTWASRDSSYYRVLVSENGIFEPAWAIRPEGSALSTAIS